MKKQNGFTLIELVVVIVILGILAVTAAPKFLDLQSDAREASLNGMVGSIKGAASIVYSKAAIEGVESTYSGETVGDDDIVVYFGYPDATDAGIGAAVSGLESTSTEWSSAGHTSGAYYAITFYLDDVASPEWSDIVATGCYVRYNRASSAADYVVSMVVTGC